MTSKFTREELLNIIDTDHVQCGEASALARMALAAMDSEPVAWRVSFTQIGHESNNFTKTYWDEEEKDRWVKLHKMIGYKVVVIPLYRHAQPAPVVPDKMTAIVKDEAEYVEGWNACRTAMLQELQKSAGDEATCRSNENVQVLTTINPAPTLDLLPKNAESLTGNSPAQSNCCPAQNHVSPEQNGDTPAQNQGWIPVSEQMPEREVDVQVYCPDKKEQMVAYLERNELEGYFRFATWRTGEGIYCQPTHWMQLPAGPREVKGE